MKNIIKSLVVLLSSISLFATANAGELTVTGTASATYSVNSGYASGPAGIGIKNHLDFTGSGETDLGTFKYSIQQEPGTDGTPSIVDQSLTLTTSYGTFGAFVSEGGLDLEDGASRSVWARPTDGGFGDGQVDNPDISSYSNVQYHTPAGLLPFGIVAKVAYAPNADTTIGDTGTTGAQTAEAAGVFKNVTAYQVTASPMDGLSVGANYMEVGEQGVAGTKDQAQQESGAAYIKYDVGAFGLGYSKSLYTPAGTTAAAQTVEYYEADNYSVAFNVNENLSISYEVEKNTRYTAETAGAAQSANADITSRGIQAAYTVGGMTLAVAHNQHDDVGYAAGKDATQTIFAVTMAF
jgi:hypothetical protein